MKKILGFVSKVVKSKFTDKEKLGEWYKERIDICNACPKNSKYKKRKNLIYWFWSLLSFKKDFCTLCGCTIVDKASVELENCSDTPKRWKSLI